MNLSGNAVRYWRDHEKIDNDHLLVLVDDLALPFGAIRLKANGSDAGHNGLKNIAAMLGTQAYPRLRFGIGNDFQRGQQIEYVLGAFTLDHARNCQCASTWPSRPSRHSACQDSTSLCATSTISDRNTNHRRRLRCFTPIKPSLHTTDTHGQDRRKNRQMDVKPPAYSKPAP